MEPSSSSIPRPSGLPRPSRLPVLRSSTSQSQLRPVQSQEQLQKKPSTSSLTKTQRPTPSHDLQKKPSRTSLAKPTWPTPSQALQKKLSRTSLSATTTTSIGHVNGRVPLPTPIKDTSTSAARKSTENEAVFKKPASRPPSRQLRTKHPNIADFGNNTREQDGLGALDCFRASSRQGFREREPQNVAELEDDNGEPPASHPRKSRPSLSDRTIESLAQIPPSPGGKGRRRSSFFTPESPMPPPARPASALGNNRRPGTSDGSLGATSYLTPTTPSRRIPGQLQRGSMTAPGKRSVSAVLPQNASTPSKLNVSIRPAPQTMKQPLAPMQNLRGTPKLKPNLTGSKTMTARTPKSRPALAGLFGQAGSPPDTVVPTTPTSLRGNGSADYSPESTRKVSSSSAALREQIAKAKAARRSGAATQSPDSARKMSTSSGALREQIAKAKEAARRAAAAKQNNQDKNSSDALDLSQGEEGITPDPAEIAAFDFGIDQDPFNQRPKGNVSLIRKRVDAARLDGRLNIAAMGLSEIPEVILKMYDFDSSDSTIAWGEVVDLMVLIAADNELEVIPDEMFPNVDIDASLENDDVRGSQFAGVQVLDFHGNILREIPRGLGRLEQITKLNLARNQLTNDSLDVISQISSLRDLNLSQNALQGRLPESIRNLKRLEVLNLQENKLTSLPDEIEELANLRVLMVSNNQLKTLPSNLFTEVRLVELLASNNALSGSLFPHFVENLPHLIILHIASNSLTSLCEAASISMPMLRTINMASNQIRALPDLSSWTSLVTLLARENKLSELPDGFTALPELRNADFTANDLVKLDERISLMEKLENFTVAANPLRDRKFLTMNTEDIKKSLQSRMAPSDLGSSFADAEPNGDEVQASDLVLGRSDWILKPSGTLDLSSGDLSELDEDKLTAFVENNEVRQIYLNQNNFSTLPPILSYVSRLTVLDLSKNNIIQALTSPVKLPNLRELRLAGNKILSLDPLIVFLSAPNLQHLDVSNNRISGTLPVLRQVFPDLMLFMASDNAIAEISAESLSGLKVANLSNNEIGRLPPEIGLLAGTLTSLEVEGNTFRVPNFHVLRKGTEAVLTWLRAKIPDPDRVAF